MAEASPEYSQPILSNGRYRNPWDSWTDPKLRKLFSFMFMKSNANIPTKEVSSVFVQKRLTRQLRECDL